MSSVCLDFTSHVGSRFLVSQAALKSYAKIQPTGAVKVDNRSPLSKGQGRVLPRIRTCGPHGIYCVFLKGFP